MSTTSTLVNALVEPSEASALITTLLYGVYLGMNYLYFTSDRSPSWPRRITFAINFILLSILVSFVFAANYIRDVKWYGNPIVLLTPDIAFKVCLLQRPSSWTITQYTSKGGLVCTALVVLTSHVQYYVIIYQLASRQVRFSLTVLRLLLSILLLIDFVGLCIAIVICVRLSPVKSLLSLDVPMFTRLALAISSSFVAGQTFLTLLISYVLLTDQAGQSSQAI